MSELNRLLPTLFLLVLLGGIIGAGLGSAVANRQCPTPVATCR